MSEPDAARLEELLRPELPGARVTNVTRIFGGNARRAWSFDAKNGDRELHAVLLSQVERGQLDSDPGREYRVLRGLHGAGVRAPGALAVDERGEVLGWPSVVLERMPGAASVTDFLDPADPDTSSRLTEDLARAAAELHDADVAATGLDGDPPAVVAEWRGLFEDSRLEPHPVLAAIYGWLGEHVPEPRRLALVHGDLRAGNFLAEEDRITALLDWEMAHLGDGAEDLAWAYRPLWSPERFLALEDFLAVYDEHAAVPADRAAVLYYRVFSEAKFATISLRAARAFHEGWSANLRLADRAAMVTACLRQALDWIDDAAA